MVRRALRAELRFCREKDFGSVSQAGLSVTASPEILLPSGVVVVVPALPLRCIVGVARVAGRWLGVVGLTLRVDRGVARSARSALALSWWLLRGSAGRFGVTRPIAAPAMWSSVWAIDLPVSRLPADEAVLPLLHYYRQVGLRCGVGPRCGAGLCPVDFLEEGLRESHQFFGGFPDPCRL